MTTEQKPQEQQAEQKPAESTDESGGPKELRAALDRERERREALESRLKKQAFDGLGLDPEKGIGKAVDTLFEGDKTDPDALREYVSAEFPEWQPAGEAQPQSVTQQQQVTQPPQQRVEAATAGGVPSTPGSLEQQIQDAEREGRWADASALKLRQFNQATQ